AGRPSGRTAPAAWARRPADRSTGRPVLGRAGRRPMGALPGGATRVLPAGQPRQGHLRLECCRARSRQVRTRLAGGPVMQRTVLRAVVCALALGCLPAIMLGPDDPAPTRSVAASGPSAPAAPGPPAGTHPAARTGRPVGRPQVVPGARLPRQPITTFAVRGRAIALTFDDGPDPRWTPAVLDLLRRYHAHAVFCVVGVHVTAYPGLVRRIAPEGHAPFDHT